MSLACLLSEFVKLIESYRKYSVKAIKGYVIFDVKSLLILVLMGQKTICIYIYITKFGMNSKDDTVPLKLSIKRPELETDNLN